MLKYIMKRLVQLIPILLLVSIIIFCMVRLSGIDPVVALIGDGQTSPQVIQNISEKYNLNKPLPIQYILWVGKVLRGDFGVSYKFQQSVTSLIQDRLPVTLGLALLSSIIAVIIAIPAGVISAVKKNTWVDRILSVVTLILFSSPVFLTSIVMILIISKVSPEFSFTGTFSNLKEYFQRIIFPVIALAFHMIALMLRVTRSSMIEQMQSNYILTVVAKGLPSRMVIFKHALKNAIIPVITVAGIQIGSLIVGTVLVENVFSLPGIGSLLIDSIKSSDYPIVQGITLLLVTTFLLISLLVDVFYVLIDPRIRLR